MTGVFTRGGQCVIRTADADEQSFFTLLAAEAGFDTVDDAQPACQVDGCWTTSQVRVALRYGCVAGFYQLAWGSCAADDPVLDCLYVHHTARRTGVGRALFDDLRRQAIRLDLAEVRIVAHPAAESFFHRVGAERIGTVTGCSAVPWSRPAFRVVPSRPAARGLTGSGRSP